jgi:hypothetical protein
MTELDNDTGLFSDIPRLEIRCHPAHFGPYVAPKWAAVTGARDGC